MKIHRFIDNFDLKQKELEITGKIAHQIIKVLKFEINEKIELSDGKGTFATANIIEISKDKVIVKIEKIIKEKEDKKNVLFCAILKKENFELVVQKATECGISKIVPIITNRTIKTGLNLGRLEKIAKEASEQSGRSIVPEINEPIAFEKSLELINKNDLNILFDSQGELLFKMPCERDGASTRNFSAEKYPCILNNNSPIINIFIGPEGGWTPDEIEKAKNLNFKIASLGKLTLRAETASIIASYLISNN